MNDAASPAHQGIHWRKSSFSQGENDCVEVASLPAGAAVRDSKNPDGGALLLRGAAWDQFRATAKRYDSDAL